MGKAAKRWLYLGHRWTGIALCLLFATWFASGIVMIYVPFPSFRVAERIAGSPPIDWDSVRIDPGTALATLRPAVFPEEMRLSMTAGEPVYRFGTENDRYAVSAVTGEQITGVSSTQAKAIASSFVRTAAISVDTVERDQWVVAGSYARMAPFWRVRMADADATDIYVAKATGEIAQNTTAFERRWNWAGSIPHWIYFETLRSRQDLWRNVVLWTSGVGLVGAAAGLWIGVLRVRLRRRYRSGAITPYRNWMKLHHIAGLAGGVFLVGWIFSGWLSMSPWGGLRDQDTGSIAARYQQSRPIFPHLAPALMTAAGSGAREMNFTYIGGRPAAILVDAKGVHTRIDGETGLSVTPSYDELAAVARRALPQAPLASGERLTRQDSHWYATLGKDAKRLPVLRFKFSDPARTWLHIDPVTGELIGHVGNRGRANRWLFNALHCFDFLPLIEYRLLREGLMWLLSAAGIVISVSGVVIGWRRLTGGNRIMRARRFHGPTPSWP